MSVGDVVNLTAWASFPAGVSIPKQRTWDAVQDGFEPEGVAPDLWAPLASVKIAIGKVHRPRISAIRDEEGDDKKNKGKGPFTAIDKDWADEAGLAPGQSLHLVNILRANEMFYLSHTQRQAHRTAFSP